MGTGSFSWVKRPGRGVDHPSLSSDQVKERVELHLYFFSIPSCTVLGWTLPLLLVCSLFVVLSPHINSYVVHLCIYHVILVSLTLILLTWRIWWAPNNASKWQMGFKLAFKGLKVKVCNNYRGLSLLPTTCKILSNILLSRLIPYAAEIVGDHQCGFRRNRSTTDHIFCIRQILEKKNGNTMRQYMSSL